jgi:hypothetical protein
LGGKRDIFERNPFHNSTFGFPPKGGEAGGSGGSQMSRILHRSPPKRALRAAKKFTIRLSKSSAVSAARREDHTWKYTHNCILVQCQLPPLVSSLSGCPVRFVKSGSHSPGGPENRQSRVPRNIAQRIVGSRRLPTGTRATDILDFTDGHGCIAMDSPLVPK